MYISVIKRDVKKTSDVVHTESIPVYTLLPKMEMVIFLCREVAVMKT